MISLFNATYLLYLASLAIITVLLAYLLKNRTRKEQLNVLKWIALINFLFWIIYKIRFVTAPDFTGNYKDKIFPFQPCNTLMWLGVYAYSVDNRRLESYLAYAGIFFPLLALLMPEKGFERGPFFTIPMLGYYYTHGLDLVLALLLFILGIVDTKAKNCVEAGIIFMVLAFIIHLINFLFRITAYNPAASYYYTYGCDDNPILVIAKHVIPINVIYMFPLLWLSIGVLMLINIPVNRLKAHFREKASH